MRHSNQLFLSHHTNHVYNVVVLLWFKKKDWEQSTPLCSYPLIWNVCVSRGLLFAPVFPFYQTMAMAFCPMETTWRRMYNTDKRNTSATLLLFCRHWGNHFYNSSFIFLLLYSMVIDRKEIVTASGVNTLTLMRKFIRKAFQE